MQTGAAAAIYYGERFYQLPVGILGLAIATVIYPLLSRHAARGDRAADRRRSDARPAAGVVHGAAGRHRHHAGGRAADAAAVRARRSSRADDAPRGRGMIACYASGVWAYCAIPVLVRGLLRGGRSRHARQDRR